MSWAISNPGPKAFLWEGLSAQHEQDRAWLAGPGDPTQTSPSCAPCW